MHGIALQPSKYGFWRQVRRPPHAWFTPHSGSDRRLHAAKRKWGGRASFESRYYLSLPIHHQRFEFYMTTIRL
jgi:hypothetical protein